MVDPLRTASRQELLRALIKRDFKYVLRQYWKRKGSTGLGWMRLDWNTELGNIYIHFGGQRPSLTFTQLNLLDRC